jgi:hypothetical protein
MPSQFGRFVRRSLLCLGLLSLSATGVSAAPASALANRWSFLENTYWTVPAPNLRAYVISSSAPAPLPAIDQTVYHVTHYKDGFFWGVSVTSIDNKVTCAQMMGSVTPPGRVLLSFVTTDSSGVQSQQVGYGQMAIKGGAWTMLNQTSAISFAHWAYMVQSKPGDSSWHSLPGVHKAVPDFLAQCQGY